MPGFDKDTCADPCRFIATKHFFGSELEIQMTSGWFCDDMLETRALRHIASLENF
jgi:hypothetical protein